jgi:uncharacterized protein YceH (UPF0502 family)
VLVAAKCRIATIGKNRLFPYKVVRLWVNLSLLFAPKGGHVMPEELASTTGSQKREWRPLDALQRRVVGVLIEKAKTTPDGYPLSLNALTNGCNQKSNRSPQMTVGPTDVEQSLDELREMGAVTEIQGSGRVPKYRHRMYEWLGVDKSELAVMAELLLRGAQSVGELRARASRMEPISGQEELKPILRSLIEKNLVVPLTPEGRGQIVTHGLYTEHELAEVKAAVGVHAASSRSQLGGSDKASRPVTSAVESSYVSQQDFHRLRDEVAELREELVGLREKIDQIQQMLDSR